MRPIADAARDDSLAASAYFLALPRCPAALRLDRGRQCRMGYCQPELLDLGMLLFGPGDQVVVVQGLKPRIGLGEDAERDP